MGDRTYYRLALPADLDREAIRMAAIAFTDEPWTDDDVTRLLDHTRPDQTLWVDIEERSVGECRDAAEAVLTALTDEGQDVAFTVTEDPKYEWLGTLCRYQPGKGMHEVSTASDFETYPGVRDGVRQIGAPAADFETSDEELETASKVSHPYLAVDRGRSDLNREIPTCVAKVSGGLAQPALPLWIRLSVGCQVEGANESIGDALGSGPRPDRASCVTSGLANETDPT